MNLFINTMTSVPYSATLGSIQSLYLKQRETECKNKTKEYIRCASPKCNISDDIVSKVCAGKININDALKKHSEKYEDLEDFSLFGLHHSER